MVVAALSVLIGFAIVACICGLPTVVNPTVKRTKLEETPGAIEGDMFFAPTKERGVAVHRIGARWTNGIIPYEILPGYEAASQAIIIAAMRKMEIAVSVNNIRCIQFRPKIASDLYSIKIVKGIGCSSYVGQPSDPNFNHLVTLQDPGCIDDGRIMHELLHTLGFYHEQSRPDRDSYVRINTANILAGYENNFLKYDDSTVDTQSTPYDYGSVMHYERDAFSRNGLPTVEPLQSSAVIGQRVTISPIDIQEVQLFYGCTATRNSSSTSTTTIRTTTTTPIPVVISMYSSAWTNSSPRYARAFSYTGNFFYEPIRVFVSTSGYYTFSSNSSIDTFGYIYTSSFDASNSSTNLLLFDDDSAGNAQFRISVSLQPNIAYILVATTYNPGVTGPFSIIASGPARVTLIYSSITTTTSTTTQTTTPSICTTPTNQPICPTRVVTNGRIVTVNPIGRRLTGTSFVTSSTVFNADDRITTNGYIKNVTVQYQSTRLPTTTARIWIYGIVSISGGYIACSQYLIPLSQITTQAIQTYTLNDNTINVFNGAYVGVGILDTSASVASTYGGLALYTEGADQSTNIWTRSTLYFRPDTSRFGVKITYTIVA